ncbi:hypothetical protein ANO11243_059080 [Dothideomycetidae sp. 11243]|nr:hypothetical protein ANO11243_059080 [fungal sp. No.11243]
MTKKIQRNVIVKHGYVSVELWAAAMHVFTVSRKIYMLAIRLDMDYSQSEIGENETPTKTPPRFEGSRSACPSWKPLTWAQAVTKPKIMTVKELEDSMKSLLHIPGLGVDSRQQLSNLGNQGSGRGKRINEKTTGKASPPSERKLQHSLVQKLAGLRYMEWQEQHLRRLQALHGGASDGYRDRSLKCQLPLTLCNHILPYTADQYSLSILSPHQRVKAFEWGQLHDSLKTEADWRNKDQASQVWMLLEALECLEYGHEQ